MNFKKPLQAILCAALLTGALPIVSAAAESDVVYGTMQIPYSDFYAAEGVASDVDAVSSATTSKWKNENLTAGTYSAESENGGGTIFGVVYPVAISKEALSELGENNYGFTELDSVPAAYKEVTVDNGAVSFSAVKGATAAIDGVTATITTDTRYGDYCIDAAVNNANGTSDVGRIYGVILHTENGDAYGMRHLGNIWRDEIAWSSGFVTSEPHGNTLAYEDYVSLVGQTVTEITYITDSGYHTLATNLYVPVKFENILTVSDSAITSSETAVSIAGFPEDYSKEYSVDGLNCTITDTSIAYQDALAGSYTLLVHDAAGKYADVKATFTLTTDAMPAAVSGTGLVKADGASDADYANFLKKISSVTVGENTYVASGKRGVKIIGEDGSIDAAAASRDNKVFAEDGTYAVSVAATGYTASLDFTVTVSNAAITSVSAAEATVVETPAQAEAETTTTAQNEVVTAPQTADNMGLLLAAVLMTGAAGLGLTFRKKKN